MAVKMDLWSLADDGPTLLRPTRLDLESQLEDWICADPTILGEDLLILDRQVTTDHGHQLDILAMDSIGNLVIVELKRDKTPREVVAQVLDYASWVAELSAEQIEDIGQRKAGGTLEQVFRERFGVEPPESLNSDHRMLVVATELDAHSERIVTYLSQRHGLNINVLFFNFYRTPQGEFLARSWLLPPEQVEQKAKSTGRTRSRHKSTLEDLENKADERGVGDLYRYLFQELSLVTDGQNRAAANIRFNCRRTDGSRQAVISLYPGTPTVDGTILADVRVDAIAAIYGLGEKDIRAALPGPGEQRISGTWVFDEGHLFKSWKDVDRLVALLRKPTGVGV